MRAVAVACATVLMLTGCVQVVQPPAPETDNAARDAYAEQWIDSMWSNSTIPDQRPADIAVTFVKQGEWGPAVQACMEESGYAGYVGQGDSLSWSGPEISEAEELTRLVCMSTYQSDPQILSAAQLGYLYDFYRDSTVPCLELAGVEVVDAPSRAEFIESGGGWFPAMFAQGDGLSYYGIDKSPWYRSAPDKDLSKRCVKWPPGWDVEQPLS